MFLLKQSTAKAVSFGPFVDKTDGVTPETGLVSALDHGTTGILLSKNGGALTIRHASVTASTYDAYGNYIVTLDTTDTNTLGTLRMQFIETATCLPVWMDFMVVPATVYDALITNATTAAGGLGDIQRMAGTALTGRDIGASVLLSSGTGTGQVKLSNGYVAPNWGDVGNPTATVGLSGTTVKTATDVETDTQDIQSRLPAALVNSRMDSTVDGTGMEAGALTAIRGELTTELGRIDAAVSTRATPAHVNTECDAAISDAGLPAATATAVWAAGTRTLTSITGLGIALAAKLTKYVQLLARKDSAIATDNATELTEINANGGSGAGSYTSTTDALEAIRDRGDAAWLSGGSAPTVEEIDAQLTSSHGSGSWQTGGDSGSGANTVTITVDDGTDPIIGAKVRLTEVGGAGAYLAITNDDGEVSFSVDSATWIVAITKPLYSFTPEELEISDDTEQTYSMTAVSIPVPDDPALCTLAVLCVDAEGEPKEGVIVSAEMVSPPTGDGYAFDRDAIEAASDEEGLAELTVVRGATYAVCRGGGPSAEVVIPDDEDVVSIDNLLGSEP